MAKVEIYTRAFCPYCVQAVRLLGSKNVDFKEVDAGMDAKMRAEMTQRAKGASTYPQIFINDRHIGGCDDLHELEYAGKLDGLLAAQG